MEIDKVLDEIENKKIVLPEFQREYIWSREQARQLLISLIKGFPVGSLLFWQTNDLPDLKNIKDLEANKKKNSVSIILDGQHRLTTLYIFIKDSLPPFYVHGDIENDPRSLYYNLETSFFEYYHPSKQDRSPIWQRVVDVFTGKVSPQTIFNELQSLKKQANFDAIKYNYERLIGIKSILLPRYSVANLKDTNEAIEVFDRINSMGTPLTESELFLAHIVSKWGIVRRVIKEKRQELEKQGFSFSFDFYTRGILIALVKSSIFQTMNHYLYARLSANDYQSAWTNLTTALKVLIPVLKEKAYISSSSDLPTENLLIPILGYLIQHGRFTSAKEENRFFYWMFNALIYNRYSGQFEDKLDRDVYLAINESDPTNALITEIAQIRGSFKIYPDDLIGKGVDSSLSYILFLIMKKRNPIDWVTGNRLYEGNPGYRDLVSQHIFPQNLLYERLYGRQNILERKKVNEIANRFYITRSRRYTFAHTEPIKYFGHVSKEYLDTQLIPSDTLLWHLNKYESFLQVRRELIASEINSFIDGYSNGEVFSSVETNINTLIEQGENHYVEFKPFMRWDYYQHRKNRDIEFLIAKTIAAFMNSAGGNLLIGVANDGVVLGLENDYKTLGNKQDADGFLLHLTQIVNFYLGKDMNAYCIPSIVGLAAKDICVVKVIPAPHPVFISKNNRDIFYIRAAASSEPLSRRQTRNYIRNHWK